MSQVTSGFEREVRFGVVIYGGVSLAVYINGIVQEMLHMVRATAPSDGPRSPSEEVYRKLACMLSPEGGLHVDENGKPAPPAHHPTCKFVVDILSGTSAGGINAIYLAKALANNQSLKQLALMWINVADIAKLLNDRGSEEPPVRAQSPPRSLLNSHWMYLKLLEALDGMEESRGAPLVEDLDLFSTTTDIDGVGLPIALADKQVMEFRHRNVFHFQKRGTEMPERRQAPAPKGADTGERNDFTLDNNPFLAFAARCTSAFPFAFEPMALCDIFGIIQNLPPHQGQPYCTEDTDHWQKFYLDYIRDADPHRETPFSLRSFGDGGYLDNKPFSYAIETIMTRHADVPVDRKLIYVEPSPEDIGRTQRKRTEPSDRPDAVENSLAALIDLPRYETIRQDLERVLEWNRTVARIRRVLADPGQEWATTDVAQHKTGASYLFYERLRLSAVTDSVASGVAEAMKLDPNSARGDAIRMLAGAWRSAHVVTEADKKAFLDTYDIDYLRRAIQFLRSHLLRRRAELRKDRHARAGEWAEMVRFSGDLKEAKRRLHQFSEKDLPDLTANAAMSRDAILNDLECVVNPQLAAVAWKDAPLKLNAWDAEPLGVSQASQQVRVAYLMRTVWDDAIAFADAKLKAHFAELAEIRALLTPIMLYWDGWDRFDVHDSLVFPVIFGTNAGEINPIAVIRISPDDVADIVGVDDQGLAPPKLKGQQFGAFGGFFDRRWRLHDMLRGRLQAAERLITSILPDADRQTMDTRESLIIEAQSAIARDWNDTFATFLTEEAGHVATQT